LNPTRLGIRLLFTVKQVAEKYLKALLQEPGLPVPRTHNLVRLLADLLAVHPSLARTQRGLRFLTDFTVDFRYPGKSASRRQMESALRWAERVRQECRTLLGIKPPAKKKT
jgi:HEPN domain-containing protein